MAACMCFSWFYVGIPRLLETAVLPKHTPSNGLCIADRFESRKAVIAFDIELHHKACPDGVRGLMKTHN